MGETMNICDSYCHKCVYYQRNSASCNFIFEVGRSRGCPPGTGCVERLTSREIKKRVFALKVVPAKKSEIKERKYEVLRGSIKIDPKEEESRLQLYRSGYSDLEIGTRLGTSKGAIAKWRRARNLPANFDNKHQRIIYSDSRE